MDIATLQQEAWDCAESKGLHDNLRCGAPVGTREHFLARCALLHMHLDEATQHAKRHGCADKATLIRLLTRCATQILFLAQHLDEGLWLPSGTVMTPRTATLIRLALISTEVSEAVKEVEDAWPVLATNYAEIPAHLVRKFSEEIADAMIRQADLAQEVGGDLDTSTTMKTGYNRMRPYQYGTPGETVPKEQTETSMDRLSIEHKNDD